MNAMTPFDAAEIAPHPVIAAPRSKPDEQPRRHDPSDYAGILEKHDDHLIRDIGLTRAEILGPGRFFWSQWLKTKLPWRL
ncbi:MAG: hypothetical protein LJE67_07025 [Salaquimonas sp.]|nr:hypothetical protein [Salaquimonas sp.]